MKKYTLAVIITNRTNYSKLKLVLREINLRNELEIKIIASSSILLEKYGAAYHDLELDGLTIDATIDCLLMNDSHEAMVNTVGLSMIKHSSYFTGLQPDMLIVVGDRFDTMSPALAAMMMNIPIAHIQGGEVTGTIDDKVRDLITIGSTLHFVATEKSKDRLKTLGIHNDKIFNYGCPAVEYISSLDIEKAFRSDLLGKKFKRRLDIKGNEKYFLVLAHPDTTNENDISMDVILSAIERYGYKALVFYPNVDANNSKILSDISKHKDNQNYYMIRHMPLEGFVHAMSHACCMIGNSSAGIREAASFGTPVVNIGNRQQGRERNNNVVDSLCDQGSVEEAIKKALSIGSKNNNLYHKENCSKNIVDRLISYLFCNS